jgi:uncharacterized protein involved in outer membrane biogenesis
MKRVVFWTGGIVAVLMIAIGLVTYFFQWSWLRGPLEARLSAATGKRITIEGPITGDKSWVPHITLNQIRIAAPDFVAAPQVGTIDRVQVAIDLTQLLHGRIDLPEIVVDKPVLTLMRNADGEANWANANASKGPPDRSTMPLIGVFKLDQGKLTFRDPGKHLAIDATIETIAANGGSGQGDLTLNGHGIYRQAPFTIRFKGGSLSDLRDTAKPYSVDAAASVGKTKVTVTGTVQNPFKLTDMNLKLIADGDNAEELYPLFGVPAPATPPYHLEGTLDRDGPAWLFKNFAGKVGVSDLEGSLRFETERKRLFVGGKLKSTSLDFADLGLLVGAPGSTEAGHPVSDTQRQIAQRVVATGRVLPDAPLNLDLVRNVDADVQFEGEHIKAKTLPLEDLSLHLTLDNALLSLTPLNVDVAGGRIESNVVIDARQNTVSTDYDVRFRRFQAEQFFAKAGFPNGGSGQIDGRIRLHGTGNSVRTSLASSNGEASVVIDQGKISALVSNILGLDVARTLGILITGDTQIALRCAITDFTVENGLMKPRVFVIDTDDTLITGSGTINLADEGLDLGIRGKSKGAGSLSLGGPITIGGTFRSPDVGLGAEAIARGGAAIALGALLTPVAAALGFINPGTTNADCSGLTAEANADTSRVPAGTKHVPAAAQMRRSRSSAH